MPIRIFLRSYVVYVVEPNTYVARMQYIVMCAVYPYHILATIYITQYTQ